MNILHTSPLNELGYHFISGGYLPEGKDEYYLRDQQQPHTRTYRNLQPVEVDILIRNNNTSDNWQHILVTDGFNANQVRNCKFFGLIRIGKLDPVYREFHNLRVPVGLYNSTIISSDIGDNVCIDHVSYLSHYIIDEDVILNKINELATTDNAKFGNGMLKQGEEKKQRVRIEVCNENAGRAIIPFEGMLPGDAYLWSRHRADHTLQQKLMELTENQFDTRRGFYGVIGKRTVIKSCRIIKDVTIGTDAYIKGANKLKNLTIRSDADRKSQIGEGCELVNGIVGYGCRIFYGVKAVRFITASHSQLKYGARLINSYLGNNATISCCEVLNSLIFPAHEQHHNNSFLCAALLMGQSNIAAGATIGSNHNSRSADGEIIAGRGFWPGLCVSLKHNSMFASFTILAKGDYPAELNIHIPFCLVSNDVARDQLIVHPGYWFRYNMYALERNAWKYVERDRRTDKIQLIDYDYLAPDTIQEMAAAIEYLETLTPDDKDTAQVQGFENSKRTVVILKVKDSIRMFKEMIRLHAGRCLMDHYRAHAFTSFEAFKQSIPHTTPAPKAWVNLGGQLILKDKVQQLIQHIKKGEIGNWGEVHAFYTEEGKTYETDKLEHAVTAWLQQEQKTIQHFNEEMFHQLLNNVLLLKQKMTHDIYESRAKDYTNAFRKMVYESDEEMNEVTGSLESNTFIQLQYQKMEELKLEVEVIRQKLNLTASQKVL